MSTIRKFALANFAVCAAAFFLPSTGHACELTSSIFGCAPFKGDNWTTLDHPPKIGKTKAQKAAEQKAADDARRVEQAGRKAAAEAEARERKKIVAEGYDRGFHISPHAGSRGRLSQPAATTQPVTFDRGFNTSSHLGSRGRLSQPVATTQAFATKEPVTFDRGFNTSSHLGSRGRSSKGTQ